MLSSIDSHISLPSKVVVTEVGTQVGTASNRARCDNIYCLSNDEIYYYSVGSAGGENFQLDVPRSASMSTIYASF